MNLRIEKEQYLRLKYFVEESLGEISGLGQLEFIDRNNVLITSIELFKQKTTFGSTTLNEKALATFLEEKIRNGDNVSKYNFWWHSHDDFACFWSQTDENTIQTTTSNSFLVSLVANKHGESEARLDIFQPIRLSIDLNFVQPLKVKDDKRIKQICLDEIKTKVEKRTYFKKKKSVTKGKQIYLIPKHTNDQLQSLVQEILVQLPRMSFQKWDLNI